MSTRKQVARSMVWTALESFGVSGLSIIGLIIIARSISPEELGIAAMALSIVQLINIPVEFLFIDALIRKRNAEEIDYDTAHCVSVFLGIALAGLCWFSSDSIAHALNAPHMAPVLAWMGLSVAAMGFGATIVARQRREMEFKALAIRSFVGRLIGVSVAIIIALSGGGVWSLVAQQVLMVACATLVLWVQCKQRPSFRFSYERFRALVAFGKNTVAIVVLMYSVQRLFILFVGASLSTSAAGYLNLAFRVVDILRDIVTGVVVQLALPMFSKTSNDISQTQKAYTTATAFTCAVAYPLFAGLAVCAGDFILFVFGQQWGQAVPYIALLAALTLVHLARLYSNSVLTANGHPHLPIFPDIGALLVVVIGMPLIGVHSLPLAAAVWALRIVVSLPIDVYNIKKVLGIGFVDQMRGVITPLLSAFAMVLSIIILHHYLVVYDVTLFVRLCAQVIIGASVYAGVFWLLDKERIIEIKQFVLLALKRQ